MATYPREVWKRVLKTCNLFLKRSQTTVSSTSQDILPEPILTTTVKERILELYKADPEKWSKQVLASRFKVSERTIKFLVETDRLAQSVVTRLDQEAVQHFQKMYEKRKSVESSSLLSNQRAAFSEPQPKPSASIRSWPKLERKDDLTGETTDDVLQQLGFRTIGTTKEDKQSVEKEVETVKNYLEPSPEASYKSLGLLEDAVSPRRTKYLFVDISRKVRSDCRPIYVRDFDGKLRDANREERLKVLVALGGPYDILKPYLKEYYLEKPLSQQVEEKVALQTKVALWRKLKKAKKKARRKGQSVETPKE
ncbi:hypothetical protein Gasu2_52210 [Galdieria sulphuraria]|nr:hypothetical protein Gasu2_52210 [Galdieria sulphuraria]